MFVGADQGFQGVGVEGVAVEGDAVPDPAAELPQSVGARAGEVAGGNRVTAVGRTEVQLPVPEFRPAAGERGPDQGEFLGGVERSG